MIYDKEELESIAKKQEYNDKMEDILLQLRGKWNDEVEPITAASKILYKIENAQTIVDLQATALSFRQRLNEEVTSYLQRLVKEDVKLKRATQEKMIWYALGKSPLGLDKKFNATQMTAIYDAHMAENERSVKILQGHIEFLRTTTKVLTDFGYMVKNNIEFHNYLQK